MTATGRARRAAGPRWTRARLRLVLLLLFGGRPHGRGLDTAAVADGLGVSRRSVQHWLHGPARGRAEISAANLAAVEVLVQPDPTVLEQQRLDQAYAAAAVERIGRPRQRGIVPAWRDRGWLTPHVVAILDLPQPGLRQIALARRDHRTEGDLARRGRIIDQTEVPSRFHAQLVVLTILLEDRAAWRVWTPPGLVETAPTQVWTVDAPPVDLSVRAAEILSEEGPDGA